MEVLEKPKTKSVQALTAEADGIISRLAQDEIEGRHVDSAALLAALQSAGRDVGYYEAELELLRDEQRLAKLRAESREVSKRASAIANERDAAYREQQEIQETVARHQQRIMELMDVVASKGNELVDARLESRRLFEKIDLSETNLREQRERHMSRDR